MLFLPKYNKKKHSIMSESLLLCFCDECINFPDEERWLPQYTIQYHKANNLFGGVAYNELASANGKTLYKVKMKHVR